MKTNYKFILHTLFLITTTTVIGMAQGGNTPPPPPDTAKGAPAVKMQARAYPDHIKLRWAPNNLIAWQYANQYGYQVEKYLVYQNGQVLAKPQKLNLTGKSTFKPLPLKDWEKVVNEVGKKNESYALVAAQALHGKAFGLTAAGKNVSNLKKIINQVREQDMRFAYALMASDHCLPVAKASGLYYKDNNAKKAEKYLYKVYVKLPATINYKIDTAYVYTGIDDYEPLPKPVEFSATFGNRTVMLTWNRWYYERFYVAYWVERSKDGGNTYKPITSAPIGNVLQEGVGIRSRFLYRIDSLPRNETTYHYRVRGVNSFGEMGPPSESIAGQGWENNLPLPKLAKPVLQEATGKVQLNWTFPPEQEKDIVGFVVEKARRASGMPYKLLHPDQVTLPANTRAFTDAKVDGVNYYRVGIVSKKPFKGEEKSVSRIGGKNAVTSNLDKAAYVRYTFPFLVQVPDSIPPQAPTMVEGVIDSTGKVTLRWKPSVDDDVQGYRVYRANYAGEQFSQVTKALVSDTVFIDSVRLKTLTTKVLYKVQAVDEYINPSELSKAGVLRRPDIIPPVPPVFTQVISADSGVYLGWQVSTSLDVARHALYRQERGKNNEWILIKNILVGEDTVSRYADIPPKTGVDYQYTLIAVDSSNLESSPAKPVTGRRIDNGLRGKIKKLKARKTGDDPAVIALNWELEMSEDRASESEVPESFSIYRGEELGKIRLYATVKGDVSTWKDTSLKRGTSYKYRIQANFKRGGVSKFSELVIVKY